MESPRYRLERKMGRVQTSLDVVNNDDYDYNNDRNNYISSIFLDILNLIQNVIKYKLIKTTYHSTHR
jgi:hypothetical protein